jgi:hypothetical protein
LVLRLLRQDGRNWWKGNPSIREKSRRTGTQTRRAGFWSINPSHFFRGFPQAPVMRLVMTHYKNSSWNNCRIRNAPNHSDPSLQSSFCKPAPCVHITDSLF